ncbi:MAG: hypothetical protein Q4G08_01040 [Capnocytophaga sp.]|nr:hypothetical protein [Capnocytophaga sp.]
MKILKRKKKKEFLSFKMMKNRFTIWMITTFFYATVTAQQADYIFKNVHIVSVENGTVLKNRTLAIKGGRIIEIAKKSKLASSITIDGQGMYLMPSLADAHVHLPNDELDMENFLLLNLANGVTKLRSMRGEWSDVERKKKYNTQSSYYPKLYISPPPLHRSYDLTEKELEDYVKASQKFDFMKILSIKNADLLRQFNTIATSSNVKFGGAFSRK